MNRTRTLVHPAAYAVTFFIALFFLASTSLAFAEHGKDKTVGNWTASDTPGGTNGKQNNGGDSFGGGGMGNMPGGKSISDRLGELQKKIDELLKKKDELGKILTGSTTPRGDKKEHDWKDKFCNPTATTTPGTTGSTTRAFLKGKVHERICEHRDDNASSTRPEKGPKNPRLNLQYPNGERVRTDKDGAVTLRWHNSTGDSTVDIDLKNASGTTSIAKDVAGTALREGKKGKMRYEFSYRWMNAPIGTGNTIVLTAKNGTTTYTDESDKPFEIVKGMEMMHRDSKKSASGAVLGAATVSEQTLNEMVEDIAAELSTMGM